MKRRFLSAFICALLALTVITALPPMTESVDAEEYNGFQIDKRATEVWILSGPGGDVVIPEMIDGLPVTRITTTSWQNSPDITSLVLPSTMEFITNYAFSGCTSLKSVVVHSDDLKLNNNAFNGCTELESFVFSMGMANSFGSSIFAGCSSLVELDIPTGITSIGDYFFDGCTSLTSVTMPEGVTGIGNYAFRSTGIGSITLPSTLVSLGSHAFRQSALTTISIPDGIVEIGAHTFNGCNRLESISIPVSVTTFGINAFYGCTSLEAVVIPGDLTSIPSSMFYGCSSLTTVSLPDTVTSIENSAFYGCTSMASIDLPVSLESIGANAFQGCDILESITIPDTVTSIGRLAFNGCPATMGIYFDGNAPSVGESRLSNIPAITAWWYEGKTGFNDGPWMGVTGKMLTPPDAPAELELTPFYGGVGLSWEAPEYSGGFDPFEYEVLVDGIVKDTVTGTSSELSLDPGTYSISVRAINQIGTGDEASASINLNRDLAIIIPTSTDVVRPGMVAIAWSYDENENIIDRFELFIDGNSEGEFDTETLTHEVSLKVGVYDVEVKAFDSRGDYISAQMSIDVNADYDDGTYQYTLSGDFGDGPAIITGYTGPGGEVTIPSTLGGKSVATIADDAFRGNAEITKITIPDSVKVVGNGAFADCQALESVHIGKGLEQMGAGVFDGDISLRSITFDGDAPAVDGDLLSDEEGFTVFYYEGAEGFASLWAGVPAEMISPEDELSLLLIAGAAVAVLVLVAAVVCTVLKKRKAAKSPDAEGGEEADGEEIEDEEAEDEAEE